MFSNMRRSVDKMTDVTLPESNLRLGWRLLSRPLGIGNEIRRALAMEKAQIDCIATCWVRYFSECIDLDEQEMVVLHNVLILRARKGNVVSVADLGCHVVA